MKARVVIQSWAGVSYRQVEIIGETPKRYRVRVLEAGRWPGRFKSVQVGDVKLVPKHAVAMSHEGYLIDASIFRPNDCSRAVCTCGWRGPERMYDQDAELEWSLHLQGKNNGVSD